MLGVRWLFDGHFNSAGAILVQFVGMTSTPFPGTRVFSIDRKEVNFLSPPEEYESGHY
jgi:hypothetical protein